MAPTVKVPVKVELDNAWVVSPGDKLVLGFARQLDMSQVSQLRDRFAVLLPDVEIIIVDGITHMAVCKPGGGRDAKA